MIDFRKKGMVDNIFNHYRDSCERALETEDIIGPSNYRFFIDKMGDYLKEDIKASRKEIKEYEKFKASAIKIINKLENLNFAYYINGTGWVVLGPYVSNEDIMRMTSFQFWCFISKLQTYYNLMKKLKTLTQKFRYSIPVDWSALPYPEEEKDDVIEETMIQEETPEETVETVSKDEEEFVEVFEEDLEEEDAEEVQEEETEENEEQKRERLDAFFTNS